MNDGNFDFNEFVRESKDVLVNPAYFSTMKTQGGLAEPLIKAVIYGAIAGLFTFIWSVLNIGPVTGGLFGGAIGIMAFIKAVIGAVIGLFIGGVIVLVLSAICKGSTDFEANVRVTAAVMVIMPLNALLGFTSGINFYLGAFIGLAVNIFALWIVYKGMVQALKTNPDTSKIVLYILVAVFVLFMLIGFGTRRRMNNLMDNLKSSEFRELIEDTSDEK
jgi:hypothetical protein